MNRTLRTITIAGVMLTGIAATSGCQSSCTGDPRSDNYWCARSNLDSGNYARQTASLRLEASQKQAELAALQSRLRKTNAQLAAARSSNASSNEVQKLQSEVASLQRQVSALKQP
ncbi:UNVERIFIED_ORG: hypothetical protein BCL66_105252 [Martelella mediterranea]